MIARLETQLKSKLLTLMGKSPKIYFILLQQSVNDFQPNSSQILQMFTILLHSCHFTNKMKSSGLSFIGYLYVLIFDIGLLNTCDNFILMFLFLFI